MQSALSQQRAQGCSRLCPRPCVDCGLCSSHWGSARKGPALMWGCAGCSALFCPQNCAAHQWPQPCTLPWGAEQVEVAIALGCRSRRLSPSLHETQPSSALKPGTSSNPVGKRLCEYTEVEENNWFCEECSWKQAACRHSSGGPGLPALPGALCPLMVRTVQPKQRWGIY